MEEFGEIIAKIDISRTGRLLDSLSLKEDKNDKK